MRVVITVMLMTLLSSAAYAKCYTSKEVEAEQGIRIHSELMVIGLNCQHLWPKTDKNLYLQYKDFTKKHAKVFAGYEDTMLDFFSADGETSPELRLHQMRTDFANQISKDAATMRPDAFCAMYAPRIPKAAKMDDAKIRKWASTVFAGHPVSHGMCASTGK